MLLATSSDALQTLLFLSSLLELILSCETHADTAQASKHNAPVPSCQPVQGKHADGAAELQGRGGGASLTPALESTTPVFKL